MRAKHNPLGVVDLEPKAPDPKGVGDRYFTEDRVNPQGSIYSLHSRNNRLSTMPKAERKAKIALLKLTPQELASRRTRNKVSGSALAELLCAQRKISDIRKLVIIASQRLERGESYRRIRRTISYKIGFREFISDKLVAKYAKHALAVLRSAKRFRRLLLPSETGASCPASYYSRRDIQGVIF